MQRTLRLQICFAAISVALLANAAVAQGRCANANGSGAALGADVAQTTIRCLLNDARHDRGARKLKQRDALDGAAQFHATEMAGLGYFSHTSPSGEGPSDRAKDFGYLRGGKGTVAEVIGAGTQWSPRAVVNAWLASGPHRAAILSRRYRHVGVGVGVSSSSLVFYSVSLGDR
jgi:uncharacterized protein YkwD